MLIINLLHLNL